MTPPKTFPALILAALMAAGCDSGSDAPAGPTFDAASLDACVLFPLQEALAYAKGSVSTMSSTLEDGGSRNPRICSYNAGNTDHPRLLKIEVRAAESPRAAARQMESSRDFLERLAGGEIQEVPGLGDRALWAGGNLHQLNVLHGNLMLIVTAQTDNAPKSLYIAKLIAQRALSRLQPPGAAPNSPS
jgi:hypothetical protein